MFPEAAGTDPHDLEGWATDPFGRHEQRWFSAGAPTALVRDGQAGAWREGRDEPTGDEVAPAQEVVATAPVAGDDLRRADDADAGIVLAPDLLRTGEDVHLPADPTDDLAAGIGSPG